MDEKALDGKRLMLGLQVSTSLVLAVGGLYILSKFEELFIEAEVRSDLPMLTDAILSVYIPMLLVVPCLFIVGGIIGVIKKDIEAANWINIYLFFGNIFIGVGCFIGMMLPIVNLH